MDNTQDALRDLAHIGAFLDKHGAPETLLNRLRDVRAALASEQQPMTDETIIHLWDTRAGMPTDKYPLTYSDVLYFARALLAQQAQEASASEQTPKRKLDAETALRAAQHAHFLAKQNEFPSVQISLTPHDLVRFFEIVSKNYGVASDSAVSWFCVNNVTGRMLYTNSRSEATKMNEQKDGHWTVTPLYAGAPEGKQKGDV